MSHGRQLDVLVLSEVRRSSAPGGSWSNETARTLSRHGHRVTLVSNQPGNSTAEPSDVVAFTPSILNVANAPDVVYTDSITDAIAAALRWPNVAIAFHVADRGCENMQPPLLPQIRAVTCESAAVARLVADAGVDPARITVVPVAVDPRSLKQRRPLPSRPTTAAVLSPVSNERALIALDRACELEGVRLHRDRRVERFTRSSPSADLSAYDVVFATGRTALAALATGCSVAVWDANGHASFVTPENVGEYRLQNYGRTLCTRRNTIDNLRQLVRTFDSSAASLVSEIIREHDTWDEQAKTVSAVLHDAISAESIFDADRGQAWLTAWLRGTAQALDELTSRTRALETQTADLESRLATSHGAPLPMALSKRWRPFGRYEARVGRELAPLAVTDWTDTPMLGLDALWHGFWRPMQVGSDQIALMADDPTSSCSFEWFGSQCLIMFWSHPWSGAAVIEVDDDPEFSISLYGDPGGFVVLHLCALRRARHFVVIRPEGAVHPPSRGAEMMIVTVSVDSSEAFAGSGARDADR